MTDPVCGSSRRTEWNAGVPEPAPPWSESILVLTENGQSIARNNKRDGQPRPYFSRFVLWY
jgi:hypothetical protein